mmetsp:Transcript_28775/g.79287  ORF Transcript_28775/g.79287 Transcript_28775/m.79287 type:complete len:330 (+) Transcript_28775:941-1930(+)
MGSADELPRQSNAGKPPSSRIDRGRVRHSFGYPRGACTYRVPSSHLRSQAKCVWPKRCTAGFSRLTRLPNNRDPEHWANLGKNKKRFSGRSSCRGRKCESEMTTSPRRRAATASSKQIASARLPVPASVASCFGGSSAGIAAKTPAGAEATDAEAPVPRWSLAESSSSESARSQDAPSSPLMEGQLHPTASPNAALRRLRRAIDGENARPSAGGFGSLSKLGSYHDSKGTMTKRSAGKRTGPVHTPRREHSSKSQRCFESESRLQALAAPLLDVSVQTSWFPGTKKTWANRRRSARIVSENWRESCETSPATSSASLENGPSGSSSKYL